MGDWTFFSNYGHVLVCLSRDREVRLRDVAAEVGITERAVQKIVRDLQEAGFLAVTKQGRCNRYRINRRKSLRHSLESQCTVGKLLALVAKSARWDDADRDDDEPVAAAPTATTEPTRPAAPGVSPPARRAVAPTAAPKPAKQEVVTEPPAPREAKEKKDRKKKPPADTRQQGSLF